MTTGARTPARPVIWLWRAMIVLGWALILSGLALVAWECLLWLRDGTWSRESLADLWGRVPLGGDAAAAGWDEMKGLHLILYRILHWFGRFPLSLALIVLGLASAWVGNGLHDRAEDDLAREARRLRVR